MEVTTRQPYFRLSNYFPGEMWSGSFLCVHRHFYQHSKDGFSDTCLESRSYINYK